MKLQLNSTKRIEWEKIGAVIAILFVVIFALMVINYRINYHPPTEVYKNVTNIEFVWDGITYKGKYDGDFANTQPNGTGVFTSDNGSLSYEGEWVRGLFSGSGKITYENGESEEGEFKEGKRNGRIRKYASDSDESFVETIYTENIPYARSEKYENGELSEYEYYINATSFSEMTKDAVELTTDVINEESFYNQYIYVEGEVASISQDNNNAYVRLNTDSVGDIYFSYENTASLKSMQVYMPNVNEGDNLKVYGYYIGVDIFNVANDDMYGKNLIRIEPFLGIMDEKNLGINETYKEICENPYLSCMDQTEGSFIIDNVVKKGKTYNISAHKKNAENEIYVLQYEGEAEDVFVADMEIEISGYFNGQYKQLKPEEQMRYASLVGARGINTFDYDMYPLIVVENMR